jgi:hypothetical protein
MVSTPSPIQSNSVFISYRRSSSAQFAFTLYIALKNKAVDVFYDYRSIPSGRWLDVILSEIAARPYFILILAPGTLNRCKSDPNDVLLREIKQAVALERIIIPIFDNGFDFNDLKKYLPAHLATEIGNQNGIEWTTGRFQEAAIDELSIKFLVPTSTVNLTSVPEKYVPDVKENTKWIERRSFVTVLKLLTFIFSVIIILVLIYKTIYHAPNHTPTPTPTQSIGVLENGSSDCINDNIINNMMPRMWNKISSDSTSKFVLTVEFTCQPSSQTKFDMKIRLKMPNRVYGLIEPDFIQMINVDTKDINQVSNCLNHIVRYFYFSKEKQPESKLIDDINACIKTSASFFDAESITSMNILIGNLYLFNKRNDDAITEYNKALSNPNFVARASNNLGLAELNLIVSIATESTGRAGELQTTYKSATDNFKQAQQYSNSLLEGERLASLVATVNLATSLNIIEFIVKKKSTSFSPKDIGNFSVSTDCPKQGLDQYVELINLCEAIKSSFEVFIMDTLSGQNLNNLLSGVKDTESKFKVLYKDIGGENFPNTIGLWLSVGECTTQIVKNNGQVPGSPQVSEPVKEYMTMFKEAAPKPQIEGALDEITAQVVLRWCLP